MNEKRERDREREIERACVMCAFVYVFRKQTATHTFVHKCLCTYNVLSLSFSLFLSLSLSLSLARTLTHTHTHTGPASVPREVTYQVKDDVCEKHPTWKQCKKKAAGAVPLFLFHPTPYTLHPIHYARNRKLGRLRQLTNSSAHTHTQTQTRTHTHTHTGSGGVAAGGKSSAPEIKFDNGLLVQDIVPGKVLYVLHT